MEYEYRPDNIQAMTREQKQENLKRMLLNAGIREEDIKTTTIESLTSKQLSAYYNKYDALLSKYKK